MNAHVDPAVIANQDIGSRIRAARDEKGWSRAKLAQETDIPAKSIEKFEYGTMEPTLGRLKALSEALDVSRHWLLTGDDDPVPSAPPKPKADPKMPEPDVTGLAQVTGILETLDDYRAQSFAGLQRKTLDLIDRAQVTLRALEPEELMQLAKERELYLGECPSAADLAETFSADIERAQRLCGNVEARIVDTAILGVDLYQIEEGPLLDLANQLEETHGVQPPETFLIFGSWGDYASFVPAIRAALRNLAVAGNGVEFSDAERYPRRQS